MKKSLIGTVENLVVGIVVSVLIMVFVGQSLEITGNSMHPTLKNGERIIVEKVTYKGRKPQRGEVVVFKSLQDDKVFLIKRIVAIPGDTIEAENGRIKINGQILEEPYLPKDPAFASLGVLEEYSVTPIPDGFYAVMGDNRRESYDSRMFGLIPFEEFVGKAFVVYWPPKEIKRI